MSVATYEEIKDLPSHPEILLIDVRNVDEIEETGLIPCSINIPLPKLEAALKSSTDDFKETYNHDKPGYDDPVIFSCKAGGRAQRATDLAKSLGYKNVKPYKGSWTEWAEKEGKN